MTANKMPEMPEAPAGLKGWLSSHQQDLLREYIEMHGRACYLAGIEAAKACVPDRRNGPHYDSGVADRAHEYNKAVDEALTNLTALEQEFAP